MQRTHLSIRDVFRWFRTHMAQAILSDADRIKSIVRTHGGRMWQKEIVEHVAWSKAKVSMTLASMEGNQDVYRQRVGREKLVSLTPLIPESLSLRND